MMIHAMTELTSSTATPFLGRYERGLTITADADGRLLVQTESVEVMLMPLNEGEIFAVGDGRLNMAMRFEDSALTLFPLGAHKGELKLTLKKVM